MEEIRPTIMTVPQDRDAYRAEFPWLAFGGHDLRVREHLEQMNDPVPATLPAEIPT